MNAVHSYIRRVALIVLLQPAIAHGQQAIIERPMAEQRQFLIDAVRKFQFPVRNRVLSVRGKMKKNLVVPSNYMQSSPTSSPEGKRVHRQGSFAFKFDGVRGWHRVNEREGQQTTNHESGFDGQKRISFSKIGQQAPSASITCNLDYTRRRLIPSNEVADPLRLYYFNIKLDAGPSYLLEELAKVEKIEATQFDGKACIVAHTRDGDMSNAFYFEQHEVVRLCGWESRQGESTMLLRVAFDFHDAASSIPARARRTWLGIDEHGQVGGVFAHCSSDFTEVTFIDPSVVPIDFLPTIPRGVKIRDNCLRAELAAAATVDSEPMSYWWIILLAICGCILGSGFVYYRYARKQ